MLILGVLGLIYTLEEMITMIFTYVLFHDLLYSQQLPTYCLILRAFFSNVQMIAYCFLFTKFFSRQFQQFKQFYYVPLGQGILLLILFYLGVTRCYSIFGYILIVLTVLIVWCNYVLYHNFLKMREEKITHIRFVQSEIFAQKQNDLRKLRHDMLNHLMILSTMIEKNEKKEAEDYMKQLKSLYNHMEEDQDDI